jgi:hypothetical protein
MASELQFSYATGKTCYVLIRNSVGQIWNTAGSAFEAYAAGSYTDYAISAVEQGASAYYTATMPSTIAAGVYSITAKEQLAGSAAQTDPTVATGDEQWNGSVTLPLSNLATSGQLGQISPIRLARGTQILNFPVYLKSSADHMTPFTSGVVSGQIARDGGSFGALQSGAFTEIGLGYYNLQALTSGDLLANTVKLVFTANGISGGASDPLPLSFILQRTSGQ